jgi:hypothetical protein
MDELWLVCEGGPESVDAAVLTPILTQILNAGIIVESAGGSSPAPVAAFLESRRGGRAAYVLDRDYHSRQRAEQSFGDGSNEFMWRRHCIESYLLTPAVIIRAFERLRQRAQSQFTHGLPAWVAALPTDPHQIEAALCECASRRAATEAARLTVWRLWEELSTTAGRIQKRIPRPQDPAADNPEGWRNALCQEVARLREAALQATQSPHLAPAAITQRFDDIFASVTAVPYLKQLEFLLDFHGKELLKDFRDWLEGLGVRFSFDRIRKELVDAAPEVYAGNRMIYGHDDFLDLANGVRAWAGLPPLPPEPFPVGPAA